MWEKSKFDKVYVQSATKQDADESEVGREREKQVNYHTTDGRYSKSQPIYQTKFFSSFISERNFKQVFFTFQNPWVYIIIIIMFTVYVYVYVADDWWCP